MSVVVPMRGVERAAPAPEPANALAATDLPARIVELVFLARALDDELDRLRLAGRVPGFRAARGAAWAMVGAGLALEPGDMLFGTARDWPAALARGVSATALALQVFGRAGDPGLGRTGPGALHSLSPRVALSDGAPAAHLVHAAGFGLAAAKRREPVVALALFGAAAIAASDTHAALSLAPAHDARAVFVARGPMGDEPPLAEMAGGWGLPVITVDGGHGGAVARAVAEARARAVAGGGPTLIDARRGGAGASLNDAPPDVLALQAAGRLSSEAERAAKAEVRATVWAARKAAEAAPRPAREGMLEGLFAAVAGGALEPRDPQDPTEEDGT